MGGPEWDLFAGITILVVVVMLWMARATQRALHAPATAPTAQDEPPPDHPPPDHPPPDPPSDEPAPEDLADHPAPEAAHERASVIETWTATDGLPTFLYLNVVLSHGLFGGILVAAAWYAQIPPEAFGIAGNLPLEILAGATLGIMLTLANEASKHVLSRAAVSHSEQLRELLAPATLSGWLVLLVVVLPVIAFVEELIFRGALIGVLAAGYGISIWVLAVVSSIAFGLGHGIQGPGGVFVTATLGFVLATGYVLTGSLLVVIVAHYVVNAAEFVIHESPIPHTTP